MNMSLFSRKNTLKLLQNHKIPFSLWCEVIAQLPLIRPLSSSHKARLRILASNLLQDKDFTGAAGQEVTPEMRVCISAQACLPILKLGLNSYQGWQQVIIYPGAFRVERNVTDEYGVVHRQSNALSGEAWSQGPLILSWDDVQRDSFTLTPGHNVVIHEFAHKLDMLNGRANGMPPLHPDMPISSWTQALSEAYATLVAQQAQDSCINPYAATNPAEFFAVACEYFFTAPDILQQHCPKVYKQLHAYFRL